MRNPNHVLREISEKAKNSNYVFKKLYRNFYNPHFYLHAYHTKQVSKTVETFCPLEINKLVQVMKNEQYTPIPKKVPFLYDQLVLEVFKLIIKQIYKPSFPSSHQTLLTLKDRCKGVKWWIQGNCKGLFQHVEHQTLIRLLRKRVHDEKFIRLVWKFLRNGYISSGGIDSMIAEIYFSDLDHTLNFWNEESTQRLPYIRQGNNFLVGVIGSKDEAEEIRKKLMLSLRGQWGIDVEMLITRGDRKVRFLGYDIFVNRKKRTEDGNIILSLPFEVVRSFLVDKGYIKVTCDGNWKAIHRSALLNKDDRQIVHQYNLEIKCFYQYYRLAFDVESKLRSVNFLARKSLTKTFAGKYKTKVSKLRSFEVEGFGKKRRKFYQDGCWGIGYIDATGKEHFQKLIEIKDMITPDEKNDKALKNPGMSAESRII